MKERVDRLLQIPWVAHLMRTVERFGQRLGGQFAAAITYFSVLAIVPVLMVAFAGLGLTLTVFVPDVLQQVRDWITGAVAGQGDLSDQIIQVVDQALDSWRTVGTIGLLAAVWAGANWVNNIRQAVRAQMRPNFDMSVQQTNIVVQTLINIACLIGLFLLVGIMMALNVAATAARDLIVDWLHLEGPVWGAVLAIAPLIASLLAGYVLFLFIFRVFPEERVPTRVLAKGSLLGAVGTAVLLWAAGLIVGAFSGNAAAAVFGTVIIVMLYFNLFATLILMVAAWMATDKVAEEEHHVIVAADEAPHTPSNYASKQLAAVARAREERERSESVPRAAAVTAARASGGAGAVAGAALAGVVAVVAAIISGVLDRRR